MGSRRRSTLDVEPPFGLRRQELIARDVEPEVVAEGQRRYIAWRTERAAAIAARLAAIDRGADGDGVGTHDGQRRPSADVMLVRRSTCRRRRPGGTRYGTLVHAALAGRTTRRRRVDDRRDRRDTQGRIVGATDAEVASATRRSCSHAAAPAAEAARRAEREGELFREMPVTLLRDGVADRGGGRPRVPRRRA